MCFSPVTLILNDNFQTNIRPVVVCPDMSSPAQSFASDAQPICTSGSLSFFVLTGLPTASPDTPASRQQHQNTTRPNKTIANPVRKVTRLEHRKAYQNLSLRHSSSSFDSVTVDVKFVEAKRLLMKILVLFNLKTNHSIALINATPSRHCLLLYEWRQLALLICIFRKGFACGKRFTSNFYLKTLLLMKHIKELLNGY